MSIVGLLASPRAWAAALAAVVGVLTLLSLRSGRMMGRLGLPALTRQETPQAYWLAMAARLAFVVLLALSAAAPDLMMDVINGAND